jgi:hypothetical protein
VTLLTAPRAPGYDRPSVNRQVPSSSLGAGAIPAAIVRAVWHQNGQRQQCEAASEEKLAAKLAKVTERLEADAPNKTLCGEDLIAFYLSADRLPIQR